MGRKSTNERKDAQRNIAAVVEALAQVKKELGSVSIHEISRTNLYRRIAEKTGLCIKAVAYKLNHCM